MKTAFESYIASLPEAPIIPLTSGTANAMLSKGNYVYRKKGIDQTDSPFQGPTTEKEAYSILGNNPYVPTLYFYDEQGNKVEQKIDGLPFDPHSLGDLEKTAIALRHIHSLPIIQQTTRFNALMRYSYYQEIAKQRIGDDIKERKVILDASMYLEKDPLCLCHNDLWQGNILITDNQAYLLDWEFASASSPTFDLASLIEENGLNQDEADYFLRRYYGRDITLNEKQEVDTLVRFHHLLWYYWAKARYIETRSPVFLEIAKAKQEAFLSIQGD